jgi:transcriptional regulator with XRE-family HTH domain
VVGALATELRDARREAGLSQASVGRVAGISAGHVARLERGEVKGASVMLFARLFAVLGRRLSVRTYPEGVPLRDIAQLRLIARFRATLPPSVQLHTEVPLRRPGDLRAWDGELRITNDDGGRGAGGSRDHVCKLEAETVLYDLQSQERRIALKMADDGVDRVILLVADTHRNRRVLREFREHLRARFPLETAAVMRELRAGRLPTQSGIVIR